MVRPPCAYLIMPKILLVKTSSMGDIIHNLPVVNDLCRHVPGAEIDWVVEEGFAQIPAMHPQIVKVIPVALRRWRRNWFSLKTWREISAFLACLRDSQYDIVLDTQGLVKSLVIGCLARGPRHGFDAESAREGFATRFYRKAYPASWQWHAVERNRSLAAQVFGYHLTDKARYGLQAPPLGLAWAPAPPYAVLLHATSREEKLWPEQAWVELGQYLVSQALKCVLPWGDAEELARSQRLAAQFEATIPPRTKLAEMATLLAGARMVIGVDTGLTHLAVALQTPIIAIYCASQPALNGVYASATALNLGDEGNPPTVAEVIEALKPFMRA